MDEIWAVDKLLEIDANPNLDDQGYMDAVITLVADIKQQRGSTPPQDRQFGQIVNIYDGDPTQGMREALEAHLENIGYEQCAGCLLYVAPTAGERVENQVFHSTRCYDKYQQL